MNNVITHLHNLRRREHQCTVEIIENLVRCNRERAYLKQGCGSMWSFLVEELKYSNAAASRRHKAMKCADKFPQVITMLREHRVTLSSLAQVESLLGEIDSPEQLLDRIDGKSSVEVEKIIAAERPLPAKPRESVRRVAVKTEPLFDQPNEPAESRVSVRTTLTEEKFESFEEARAIISRKHPGATVEDVLNELVQFFLEHKAPKQRKPKRPSKSIPAATRDHVFLRDQNRCTFKSKSGRRCSSTHNLQIDHIKPKALGGTNDPENLRLLCAAHNREAARETFGTHKVPMRNSSVGNFRLHEVGQLRE